jgi:hypothetical protein
MCPASQDSVPDYAMLQGLIVGMFEVEAGSVSMKPITASSFKSVWSRNRGYLPVYYVKHVERFTKTAAEEAVAKVAVARMHARSNRNLWFIFFCTSVPYV